MDKLEVRQAQIDDFGRIIDYLLNADETFLKGMGVDNKKLPTKKQWMKILVNEHEKSDHKKTFFFIIWLFNNSVVGHSNINKISINNEAYMHLHLWKSAMCKKGLGFSFIKKSIPFYFNIYHLKNLFCEPYALNPAPNKTLKKLGFEFIESYETTPGWINFCQQVNKWSLSFENFKQFYS